MFFSVNRLGVSVSAILTVDSIKLWFASLARLLARLLTHALGPLLPHSHVCTLTPSLTHTPTESLPYPLTHSVTHSLTHSHTDADQVQTCRHFDLEGVTQDMLTCCQEAIAAAQARQDIYLEGAASQVFGLMTIEMDETE